TAIHTAFLSHNNSKTAIEAIFLSSRCAMNKSAVATVLFSQVRLGEWTTVHGILHMHCQLGFESLVFAMLVVIIGSALHVDCVSTPAAQSRGAAMRACGLPNRKFQQVFKIIVNTQRILTTHVGSLARPKDLLDLMKARETGSVPQAQLYDGRIRNAVAECV